MAARACPMSGRFLRQGRPFCLVMIDLDYFKSVNDRFGNSTGDRVLTEFATLLRHRHRSSDVAARLRRKDSSTFSLRAKRRESRSPFDVPGFSTRVTTSI
ncbi:hypothetical protein CKO35_14690 [Ectothiorhodospira shaposhnikovii]|uniref:diguanylate cyclase n=1 Tax=Ectothiorhodospira shaposhnikovii TaxID=1054 RepID=UPI00190586E3|nr:hypothetical protein [Ectothiorhodospira shaposhnikovii]